MPSLSRLLDTGTRPITKPYNARESCAVYSCTRALHSILVYTISTRGWRDAHITQPQDQETRAAHVNVMAKLVASNVERGRTASSNERACCNIDKSGSAARMSRRQGAGSVRVSKGLCARMCLVCMRPVARVRQWQGQLPIWACRARR